MAFLMLDTARATWEKIPELEAKKKTAECHRLLGDVASESGSLLYRSLISPDGRLILAADRTI